MKPELIKKSKYISLLLRHKPENANLTLDEEGWCEVKELLEKTNTSIEELEEIVSTNDKKRFAFNEDKSKIRASQGHSISDVKIKMEEAVPPTILYHGTARHNIAAIQKTGLQKMNRNHVHLSDNLITATAVAKRRSAYGHVIFSVKALHMRSEGHKFYLSDNNVWLTEEVPLRYISIHSLI